MLAAALDVAGAVFVAAVFGGMLFFAFVYAPMIFVRLPAETAGSFIRGVFPVYYRVMGGTSVLAGVLLLPDPESVVMLAISAVFLLVMLVLMPRINAARDASVGTAAAKDAAPAAKRFASLHRLSVIVNFAQMLVVLAVLVRLIA
jgi:hypothetical protein